MLQYEKDPLEQELHSPTTEFTRADAAMANTLVTNPGELTEPRESAPINETVRHVRSLAARRSKLQSSQDKVHALPDGIPDELLLSSGFLAVRARQAAQYGGDDLSSPRAEVVVGIVAVAHQNLPAHCTADPEVLRQIKLATYLHYACRDASDDTAPQLTAESLLRSYEYSEAEVVMRAVLALNRTQGIEAKGIKDGVRLGGLAFAAVMAAKTHYNLAIDSSDTIYGDEETEELNRKRTQRNTKLETMHELLRESEGFESSAERWLMHCIFSTSPVKLNQYLHRSGLKPGV